MPTTLRPPNSILDQFTPNVLGTFWITNEELGRQNVGFDDFNYLFDGLLSQYLYGQEKIIHKHTHIFFSENYNHKIFLAHLNSKDIGKSQISTDIDEQLSMIAALKSEKDDKKTILIFDQSEDKWLPELKQRYPQFEFKELSV